MSPVVKIFFGLLLAIISIFFLSIFAPNLAMHPLVVLTAFFIPWLVSYIKQRKHRQNSRALSNVVKVFLGIWLSTVAVFILGNLVPSGGLDIFVVPMVFLLPWVVSSLLSKARPQDSQVTNSNQTEMEVNRLGPQPMMPQPVEVVQEIDPKYAFFETIILPLQGRVIDEAQMRTLRDCINQQITYSISTEREVCRIKQEDGSKCLTLCLLEKSESLYIWASVNSEVTRIKLDVFHAEKNRAFWRGKDETNWHFDVAKNEFRYQTQGLDEVGMILYSSTMGLFQPRLSSNTSDKSASLKNSFISAVSQGINLWNSLPAPQAPPIVPPSNTNYAVDPSATSWERE